MTIDNISKLLTRIDVNNKITKSLDLTKQNNTEHAFDFCSGKDVHTTDIEEGSEFHITIRNKCPIGTRAIGNFHTHAHLSLSKNDAVPSSGDMMETIERDLDFVCVSGNGHDNGEPIVRCFNRDNIESEIHNILTTKKLEPNEDNVRKSSRSITKKMIGNKEYLNNMSIRR